MKNMNDTMKNMTQDQMNQVEAKLEDAKNFTPQDLQATVKKESKALKLAKILPTGFFSKVKLAAGLLKDYCKGNYREVPWNTIAYLGFGIAYLVSPIDCIPDVIPFVGLTDDTLLLAMVFKGISDDLDDYAKWKASQDDNQDSDGNDMRKSA